MRKAYRSDPAARKVGEDVAWAALADQMRSIQQELKAGHIDTKKIDEKLRVLSPWAWEQRPAD